MHYKTTLKNQLVALQTLGIGSVLYCVMVYFLYSRGDLNTGIIVLGIYYIVLFIPTFWLHIEYLLVNMGDLFTINNQHKIITYNKIGSIKFSEIAKIKLYMAPVWHRKETIRFLPFEDYRYAAIVLESGREIVITCFMMRDMETDLSSIGAIIEKKKRLISSPLLEKLIQ